MNGCPDVERRACACGTALPRRHQEFFPQSGTRQRPPLPAGRLNGERLLPPYFGEMGFEIRYHMAQVEPWLRHGWKIVTRRPAFYPEGSAIAAPEFFAAADQVLASLWRGRQSWRAACPAAGGGRYRHRTSLRRQDRQHHGASVGDTKGHHPGLAEIAIRKLFLEWFHSDSAGCRISTASNCPSWVRPSAIWNIARRRGAAQLPAAQLRHPARADRPACGRADAQCGQHRQQDRNSDPEWMLGKAKEIAAHLGLDLLVYGHPGGCIIPAGHRTTWDAARPDGHMARELGYLKSCRIMLAPNSGWADLMAWLQIPALLEGAGRAGTFEPLRDCFKPRLAVLDRDAPAGPQADALIAATGCVLPDEGAPPLVDPRLFPWEP